MDEVLGEIALARPMPEPASQGDPPQDAGLQRGSPRCPGCADARESRQFSSVLRLTALTEPVTVGRVDGGGRCESGGPGGAEPTIPAPWAAAARRLLDLRTTSQMRPPMVMGTAPMTSPRMARTIPAALLRIPPAVTPSPR